MRRRRSRPARASPSSRPCSTAGHVAIVADAQGFHGLITRFDLLNHLRRTLHMSSDPRTPTATASAPARSTPASRPTRPPARSCRRSTRPRPTCRQPRRAQGLRVRAHATTRRASRSSAASPTSKAARRRSRSRRAWPRSRPCSSCSTPARTSSASDDLYGGTFRLFDKVRRRSAGLRFSYVDLTDPENLLAALTPDTRSSSGSRRRPTRC